MFSFLGRHGVLSSRRLFRVSNPLSTVRKLYEDRTTCVVARVIKELLRLRACTAVIALHCNIHVHIAYHYLRSWQTLRYVLIMMKPLCFLFTRTFRKFTLFLFIYKSFSYNCFSVQLATVSTFKKFQCSRGDSYFLMGDVSEEVLGRALAMSYFCLCTFGRP